MLGPSNKTLWLLHLLLDCEGRFVMSSSRVPMMTWSGSVAGRSSVLPPFSMTHLDTLTGRSDCTSRCKILGTWGVNSTACGLRVARGCLSASSPASCTMGGGGYVVTRMTLSEQSPSPSSLMLPSWLLWSISWFEAFLLLRFFLLDPSACVSSSGAGLVSRTKSTGNAGCLPNINS